MGKRFVTERDERKYPILLSENDIMLLVQVLDNARIGWLPIAQERGTLIKRASVLGYRFESLLIEADAMEYAEKIDAMGEVKSDADFMRFANKIDGLNP